MLNYGSSYTLSPPSLELLSQEPCPGRWTPAVTSGVAFRREEHVRWRPLHGGELTEAVHAAGRESPVGAHVHDPAAL